MPSLDRAARELLAADPVPRGGPELVRYMGGRDAAVRTLTGLSGPPRASTYPETARGAQRLDQDRRRWRAAQRRVQRWDRGDRAAPALSPTDRRRAQAGDRERKRRDLRRRGFYARIRAKWKVSSPGKAQDDRERTIPSGGPGQHIPGEVLDGDGDDDGETLGARVLAAFLDESGMPEDFQDESEVIGVKFWPRGTPEPPPVGDV